jgi:hypothetical protein
MVKKHWSAIIYIFTALAIVVSALLFKDSEYENAWVYVMSVGFILAAALDVYSQIKDKHNDKH